jgi:adenine-specific DNA-methyltransferase
MALECDAAEFLRCVPDGAAALALSSPPYNVGKEYEPARLPLAEYADRLAAVAAECARVLRPGGSLCWVVGNTFEADGETVPLDCLLWPALRALGLKLRNRIVWAYGHGLHCTRRLSHRHETVLWMTKGDGWRFDLDAIRVPQKYPGKRHFKGPRAGRKSCHPLGKNPGDVWEIPNVKAGHVERTGHPAQFPVGLAERLVLALTSPGDLVVDPFMGSGTTLVAAAMHGRRAAGCDAEPRYVGIALRRLEDLAAGRLRTRPMGKPVQDFPDYRPRPEAAAGPRGVGGACGEPGPWHPGTAGDGQAPAQPTENR